MKKIPVKLVSQILQHIVPVLKAKTPVREHVGVMVNGCVYKKTIFNWVNIILLTNRAILVPKSKMSQVHVLTPKFPNPKTMFVPA